MTERPSGGIGNGYGKEYTTPEGNVEFPYFASGLARTNQPPENWPPGIELPSRTEVEAVVNQAKADLKTAQKYRGTKNLEDLKQEALWRQLPIGGLSPADPD